MGHPYSPKMKNRIFQIMKQEGLNQKDFAATIGISPATLSSIFNGRTSPSINCAEALHRRFPMLNMAWLMFGEGEMYLKDKSDEAKTDTRIVPGDLFEGTEDMSGSGNSAHSSSPTLQFELGNTPQSKTITHEVVKYIDKPQRKITSITIIIYSVRRRYKWL